MRLAVGITAGFGISLAATLAMTGGWAQSAAQKLPIRALCTTDSKALAVDSRTVRLWVNGQPRFFCSPGCRDKFASFPEKYVRETVYCTVQPNFKGFVQRTRRAVVNNSLYYLCCEPCVGWMRDQPWLYLKELQDPVTGKWFKPGEESPRSTLERQVYLFENTENKAAFDLAPASFAVRYKR